MMITHDQLLFEGIIYWSRDLTKKLIDFAPRMALNFKLFKQEVKERLDKGLFVSVDPNYKGVVECTRLRWVYFDGESTLTLGENGIQYVCLETIKGDRTRQTKVFTPDEVLKMQSDDGRTKLVNEIIKGERDILENHKEQMRVDRKNTINLLRLQLEKLESEVL